MSLLTITTTLTGTVRAVDLERARFELVCRSGDHFVVLVNQETTFAVLRNLDGLDLDRTPDPDDERLPRDSPAFRLVKHIWSGMLAVVEGIYYESKTFAAKTVHILYSAPVSYAHGALAPGAFQMPEGESARAADTKRLLFENPRWWVRQASSLADQWLDSLFGNKRGYAIEDFVANYRTNLNIIGLPAELAQAADEDVQECAVLSRLIYGLSAAYLMSGQERYLLAARAGVRFQRESFRISSSDGTQCMWAHARRRRRYGAEILVPSSSEYDRGSIPIYEQIYALSGLAMYYRITQDPMVLCDISRTMRMFDQYYLDPVYGGYYSHIDHSTMRPDRNQIKENDLKKNWNSIGDHIPAYLVNVILALEPLPEEGREDMRELLGKSQEMLRTLTDLILDKFPDKDPSIPYVNERFNKDWTPDHAYGWQKNRAIIGHNFKIAWNLTRVANYYRGHAKEARGQKETRKELWSAEALAARCMAMAEWLGRSMTELGVDQLRGGCFDAVEREPTPGMTVEFPWGNTKDFWQQEQAILAYLILHGATQDVFYLSAARETEAFWNLFFLDREHRGMFFRVSDSGMPILSGEYGLRGGHSDSSGYHTFELSYLAHVYTRSQIGDGDADRTLCLYFKPEVGDGPGCVNVLPDFLPPGRFEVSKVFVNDVERKVDDPRCLRIAGLGQEIVVQLRRAQ
jgi:mannose/cellobiose epimerase-like protein (N-acyl-D-glucosamine 2-epimerase family)